MKASRFTFHVSRFTFHVSPFTFHLPRFTFHVSRFTFHLLRFIKQYWGLLIALTASLVAYGGLVHLHLRTGTLTFGNVPITLRWYALAFIAYLGALIWAEWRRGLSLKVIFAAALLFRILLLLTLPTLSGDVYRYLWEGHLAAQGVSPYAYPVNSPQLDDLTIPWRAQVDHAWMASPYLPAAQFLFAAIAWLFPLHPFFFQLAMVFFDLLTGLLLVGLLRLAELPAYRSLIYLWHPLVILEVAQGAHLDAWMIFLLFLALWLTFTKRFPKVAPWLAPPVLALATLTKGLPILVLPLLFWRWRWRQFILYGLIIAAIVVPIGWRVGWGLTGPLSGVGLFGALRIFAGRWNFNSGLFHWLETSLAGWGVVSANSWGKRVISTVMLASLAAVWLKARGVQNARASLRLMAVPFMFYILLIPTVHPWYLLVLLAFLPFFPPAGSESRWRWLAVAPWLYLSWAVALSYWTYLNPLDLREFEWVRKTEWWPTLGLLIIWFFKNNWRY